MRHVILLLLALLAGCATYSTDRNQISGLTDERLCVQYGDALRQSPEGWKPLRAEIDRRKLMLQTDELSLITRKSIKIGISKCAMFAAWGHSTRDNRTVYTGGERVQHVYRALAGTASRATYVYTANGRVTGWQD